MTARSPHHELNTWLDQHGYHHAHARVEKTPHPYARKVEAGAREENVNDFDAQRWLATQQQKGACACGECQVRAKVAHEHQVRAAQQRKGACTCELCQNRAKVAREHKVGAQGAHARKVKSPTGRMEFVAKERDHHITTHGRQSLRADQFALPPSPAERRRGILGRLPIDTLARARNALARAAQMKKHGHITAAQLATVKHKVHATWPSIEEG